MGHAHNKPLPRVRDMSRKRCGVWTAMSNLVYECDGLSGAESVAHEAELEAKMRALRERHSDMRVAVDVAGRSLMHYAAWKARTEGLVRCVWECCGERALQVMRHRDDWGFTVLLRLAWNPNMTRGMYAVFAEHCTDDDFRASDNNGCTVLLCMALTFLHRTKTEEQTENVASVMCAVVQRLGPGALLAETTKILIDNATDYPAGSTPRSILDDAGDKGRTLLQRLREAVAQRQCDVLEPTFAASSAALVLQEQSSSSPASPSTSSASADATTPSIGSNTNSSAAVPTGSAVPATAGQPPWPSTATSP